MAEDPMCKESRWKYDMQETIQAELKNSFHLSPKPKINPRKLWICEADEEDDDPCKRRRRRRIPKVPNPNIGVRDLLSHIHNAATSTCCLRADHGTGRSTLGRHLASVWASKDDDIPKLKIFPAVFLVSARSIAEVLKSTRAEASANEGGMRSGDGLFNVYGNEPVSEVKFPVTHNEVSSTEATGRQSNDGVLASHIQAAPVQGEEFPFGQLNAKMQNGLYALVCSLLPVTSAIYGPVAVSEWVLEMDILLIIDDAEDLQPCGLEFLQWVFRQMRGTAATSILMTDPKGYKRITETWWGMKLIRLDLYGLGRDDIVTEAELYMEAKRTEDSSKLNSSFSEIETIPGESRSGERRTVTYTENGEPCPGEKACEMLSSTEESESSYSDKLEGKASNKTKTRKALSTSTDKTDKPSCQNFCPVNDGKTEDNSTSSKTSNESLGVNPAAFLDIMTGKRSIRSRGLEPKDDACCKPKEIRDFLSRNMCRLEKILRFPETLMQTCDMFAENPDLFDELTTATDLFWTLMHWEMAKAISLDYCRKSAKTCYNEGSDNPSKFRELSKYSLECLTLLESSRIIYKSSLSDSKESRQSLDSLMLSSYLSELSQELSLPAGKNIGNMDKTFHEKMYSWLLLVGEKSLEMLMRDVRMEEDGFEELKNKTIEMFGANIAESFLNRVFKYRDFFGLSSIPENVQNFVEKHVPADNFVAIDLKPGSSEIGKALSDGCPVNIKSKNEHSVPLFTDELCLQDNFIDSKLDSSKTVSTVNDFFNGAYAIISTAEDSEFVTEQNNYLHKNGEAEKSEQQFFEYHSKNSTSSLDCPLTNYTQRSRNSLAVENNALQDFHQYENNDEDETGSFNFRDEILGNENAAFPEDIGLNQKHECLKSKTTTNIILESDLAVSDNCKPEDHPTGERSALHNTYNTPTVTNDTPLNSVEKLGEIPLKRKKNALESLDEISTEEGKGRNFDVDNREHSCDEWPDTLKVLIDEYEEEVNTPQYWMDKTPSAEARKYFMPKTFQEDEERLARVESLNISVDDDFWGEILGSSNIDPQNEVDVQENRFLPDKCSETVSLHEENESSEERKRDKLSNENNSDEIVVQKERLSEIKKENYGLDIRTQSAYQAEESEALLKENLCNKDLVRSLDQKLTALIVQPVNRNVLGDAFQRFPQDPKTQQEEQDKCFEVSGNNNPENTNAIHSEGILVSSTKSHLQQMQSSFNEDLEEIASLTKRCPTDDCLSENSSEKFPPVPCSLESGKEDTYCVEPMNAQTVENEQRIDTNLHEKVNAFHPILKEHEQEHINLFLQEQEGCGFDESLQEQQCINEQTESVQISTQQQQLSPLQQLMEQQQQQQQQQEQPVNEFIKITQEKEKEQEQQIHNLNGTAREHGHLTHSPRGFKAEQGSARNQQQNVTLVTSLLQSLRDRAPASPSPSPVFTTKNPLLTQFLASWFLVHEIQSGRSLSSITHGSGCCLRQLCIFSAGLVNRIRKLVGYNTELNRRRVICALLNHRSDSSDDLLFNMDLVAEFKAYPDLLSFTVEASEYPDEWHVTLYEAELVPLQALLLNVAPSRILLHVEEVRPFSEADRVLQFLSRVEILVWMESRHQFAYGSTDRMDKIVESFTVGVVLAKVELVFGCLNHHTLTGLPSHPSFKNLVNLKLRVLDICSLSSLLSLDRRLKSLLWVEVRLDFDWSSEEESLINNLPRCSVPLFDVYLRGCADEHVVRVSNLLAHMHQRYSGIHLESTSLTPEGVYVLLKQLQQKEIRLYSHPTARQRFRRWYYPQLAEEPAPSDDLARERLGYDDRVFYSNHCIESNTYASAIDAWNLTSYLEEEERIVHFVYTTENLNFVKRLTGCVDVERIC